MHREEKTIYTWVSRPEKKGGLSMAMPIHEEEELSCKVPVYP